MPELDPDTERFVSELYARDWMASYKVDQAVSTWAILQRRGSRVSFPEFLVDKRMLGPEAVVTILESVELPIPPRFASHAAQRKRSGGQGKGKPSGKVLKAKAASRSAGPVMELRDNRQPTVDPDDPFGDREASSSGTLVAVVAGLAVLAVVILIAASNRSKAPPPPPPPAGPAIGGGIVELQESATAITLRAAQRSLEERDFREAERLLQEVIADSAASATERAEAGRLKTQLSSVEEAIKAGREAADRAQRLRDEGRDEEADRAINSALESFPLLAEAPEGEALRDSLSTAPAGARDGDGATRKDPGGATTGGASTGGASSGGASTGGATSGGSTGGATGGTGGGGSTGGAGRRVSERPDDGPGEAIESLANLRLNAAPALEEARRGQFNTELGEQRVARARAWVKEERARLEALLVAEAKQVKARSKKEPLEYAMTESFTIREAWVERYDDDGFLLANGRGEYGFRWDLVDPQLAFDVRKLGVIEDSADSHFRYGRFCVKHKDFVAAETAFRRAAALAPRLARRVPDLRLLERVSQTFHGEFERLGGELVSFDYPFNEASELQDLDLPWPRPTIARGQLYIPNAKGDELYVGRIRGVAFKDFARATLELGSAPGSVAILEVTSGGQGLRAFYFRDQGALSIVDLARGRSLADVKSVKARGRALRIVYRGRRMVATLDGKRIASVEAPSGLDDIQVLFGGRASAGAFAIDGFQVEGRVERSWLDKTFREADDAIAGLLADEGVGAPLSAWERPTEPLSAEDPITQREVPERVRAAIARGRLLLELGRDSRQIEEGFTLLTQAVEAAPKNPVGWYEFGRAAGSYGNITAALSTLDTAVSLVGGFHEALALRARILTSIGQTAPAKADIDAALAVRPDSAPALLALAEWDFDQGRIQAARDTLEVAFALYPRDPEIGRRLRNYTFVLRGPPFERTYKVETPHYIVISDTSRERTREYADHLEWIHDYYSQIFPAPRVSRKSQAIIFNTREGYYQYSDLTANDRVEWTLGVYRSAYNQLLLFEEGRDEAQQSETLDTLYHEGFHQFIDKVVSDMPAWLNEGFAEYFGPTRFNSYGEVTSTGAVNDMRLTPLVDYLRRGNPPLPFQTLMGYSLREFQQTNVSLNYAQSWAMIHFFLHSSKGQRDVLRSYFKALHEGSTPRAAFGKTYGQSDLRELERAWLEYVTKLARGR